nr:hypothetical protein TetV2_00062 [Oceanusvirus sp.]
MGDATRVVWVSLGIVLLLSSFAAILLYFFRTR